MEDIPKQDIWDEKISLAIPAPALLKFVYCMIDYSSSTLQKHRKSAKLPWHHTFDSLKKIGKEEKGLGKNWNEVGIFQIEKKLENSCTKSWKKVGKKVGKKLKKKLEKDLKSWKIEEEKNLKKIENKSWKKVEKC